MATANDIVSRSLRLLGVIASGETIEASTAQDALDVLNNLGQRWLANGLLSKWDDATGLTSTLTSPTTANEALSYAVALRIAPEYGLTPPDVIVQHAAGLVAELWRDRLVEPDDGTAKALILRALRMLPQPQRLPDGVNLAGALATLNAMLAEWHEAGIGLPEYGFDSTADELSTDQGDRDAIAYQLAIRLAPEYGVSVPMELLASAREAMFRLRQRYLAVSHPVPATYY